MRESQLILGWERAGEARGRLEAMHEAILQVLQARLPGPIPEELRLPVLGTNNLDKLSRWLTVAARTDSLKAFRAAMT